MNDFLIARGLEVVCGSTLVLQGIGLRLARGEFLVVVGPNGAGKTTLLETLAGIRLPSRGDILIEGRILSSLSTTQRAAHFALLGREIVSTLSLTVRGVVELGRLPHLHGWSLSCDDHAQVDQSLTEMGCLHLSERLLHTLSDGERQRVHWARALCQAPQALLLDEATAHLDLRHRESSFARARRFAEEGGAVLAVAHDLDLALRHASRVIVLDRGQIVQDATPERALCPETLSEVFGVEAEVLHTSHGPSLAIYGAKL